MTWLSAAAWHSSWTLGSFVFAAVILLIFFFIHRARRRGMAEWERRKQEAQEADAFAATHDFGPESQEDASHPA